MLSWKWKGIYNSKLKPLYTAFWHSIKIHEYRIGIKLDKDPLAIEQNYYLAKIVNGYIIYDLDSASVGSWSFDNDFAGNALISGADNSSSSHSDNRKNDCLILGQDPTYGISGSFRLPDKKINISFTKANTKFCLSLHYNADNSYLFVNGK